MKIKGVSSGKIRGQRRGDPIEHTPEEKFPLAVKDAVKAKTSNEEAWWAEEVKIVKSHFQKNSPDAKKKFQDNSYSASGSVKVRIHNLKTDTYRPAKEFQFAIAFVDAPDEYGMPDLKITSFQMT